MPLEAVMVCIDNSDFTRNGDYTPTRFTSQTDAVNLVCNSKTSQNAENAVGILTTSGDRIEVLMTPTDDFGKLVAVMNKVKIGGSSDLLRGIQTAQLALKHRQNKNAKQRIVAFVGSPVTATEKELETLGKNLKKNNVSLDMISFGEVDENQAKLDKLLNAVNNSDSSHLVSIPVGPKMISDVVLTSPILSDGEAVAVGGGGGDAGFEFGIDPNADPELALALRISMEEERARQQAAEGGVPPAGGEGAAAATAETTAPAAAAGGAAPSPAPTTAPAAEALPMATDADVMDAMNMEDMDEELRQALLLSLQESGPMDTSSAPAAAAEAPAAPTGTTEAPKPAETDSAKDAQMTDAPASKVETTEASAPAQKVEATPAANSADVAAAAGEVPACDTNWFQDPAFVSELIESLPGVDINDPRIQNALKEVGGEGDAKAEKKDEEKKDEEKK